MGYIYDNCGPRKKVIQTEHKVENNRSIQQICQKNNLTTLLSSAKISPLLNDVN